MSFLQRAIKPIKPLALKILFLCMSLMNSKRDFRVIGINFIGFYAGSFGLGVALRRAVQSSLQSGVLVTVKKLKPRIKNLQVDTSIEHLLSTQCIYPVNCININPDAFHHIPLWLKKNEWCGKYNIGYWFWELAKHPDSWKYAAMFVDEVWVSSEFNLISMQGLHDNVFKIPMGVFPAKPCGSINLNKLKIPQDSFKFLFIFDFFSSFERKNPLATIEAFLLAFPDRDSNVNLIIKSTNGSHFPHQLSQLKTYALKDPRIILIDFLISNEELICLIESSNAYVSLHRSEGFGMGLAEAMLMGKPTIATGYSGNLEFMNSQNSFLVPYQLRPLKEGEYPNWQNQFWAEPSISEASNILKIVFNNPDLRSAVGHKAKKDIELNHSAYAMGSAIKDRLQEIENKKFSRVRNRKKFP